MSRPDLTNHRFGDVVVLRKSVDQTVPGQVLWDKVCDCGVSGKSTTGVLRAGDGNTCGTHPQKTAPKMEPNSEWDFTGLEMLGRRKVAT